MPPTNRPNRTVACSLFVSIIVLARLSPNVALARPAQKATPAAPSPGSPPELASKVHATERYAVAVVLERRRDDDPTPERLELLADRQLAIDLMLNPLTSLDDHIRVTPASVAGVADSTLSVRSSPAGLRASGGNAAQRAMAEYMLGSVRAALPDGPTTNRRVVGSTWSTRHAQPLPWNDPRITLAQALEFEKRASLFRAGEVLVPLAIRGASQSTPVQLVGRSVIVRSEVSGTTWMGPKPNEGQGQLRRTFEIADATTGTSIQRVIEQISFAVLRTDRQSPEQTLARSRFEVEYASKCKSGSISAYAYPPGWVDVVLLKDAGADAGRDAKSRADAHPDVAPATRQRIEDALLAKRPELLACVPGNGEAALLVDLTTQPLEAKGLEASTKVTACLLRLVQASLEYVSFGNAQKLRLSIQRATPSRDAFKELIRGTITQHIDEVRACYERGLEGWSELSGMVRIKFFILEGGKVARAALVSEDTFGPTGCCILGTAMNWRFPAKIGNAVVTYPFMLGTAPAE